MTYQVTRLPSGLRVATAEMPQMESVSVGIWAAVGGRHEPRRVMGITHFIEHLAFKGTRTRNARQISATVEGVGGYVNAFTGEENTCFYARASCRYFDVLADVLSDLYTQARFAAPDIVKERQVIKEELMMYRDQPDHYVHELLTETLWPDQPLGWPLTGTPESLDAIRRPDLVAYQRAKYVGPNTVVAVAGRCEHADVLRQIKTMLRLGAGGRAQKTGGVRESQRAPRLRFLHKEIEQSHLVLGLRGISRHDPRRFAVKLLSVILGENMSSRLFQIIREEHGLAYSIQSSTSFFADTGVLVISVGLDNRRLLRALRLILRELRKLSSRPVAAEELRHAKDYTIGQMRLGLESTSNQMMWIAEHLLAYGSITEPAEIERQIEAVTRPDVQAAAVDLFCNHRLNGAVISSRADGDDLRRAFAL